MLFGFWVFHFLTLILTIIYTLTYKWINKFFNLNSDYKFTIDSFIKIVFCATIPILNIIALTTAIYEDVILYQKNNKHK